MLLQAAAPARHDAAALHMAGSASWRGTDPPHKVWYQALASHSQLLVFTFSGPFCGDAVLEARRVTRA